MDTLMNLFHAVWNSSGGQMSLIVLAVYPVILAVLRGAEKGGAVGAGPSFEEKLPPLTSNVNPASGLPMMGGMDLKGNPYGMNRH